ncbi:MAG: YggS family pyridoxal phosphate-dependent enzyme [Candidatus Omnitrophica bacterium]|nr:YggS family pyridoxal phosphate-dependent enzyme [Candidatus Omnitrophota bacterium]
MPIAEKISALRDSIEEAARKAERRPEEIKLVLVTKTVSAGRIEEAFRAGICDFGENRVQELLEKKKQLPAGVRWHMIGHLQTNKVKQVLGEVVLIHSLDRPELAAVIEKEARGQGLKNVDCLIQVNSTGEKTKGGFDPREVPDFVGSLAQDSRIRICGLMTIGPLAGDEKKIRESFHSIKELQEKLKKDFPDKDWRILSMGMSGDYPIAIEEGANMLRIGSAIFGPRG